MTLLKLDQGSWYGWTMWPGYGDQPYRSPVLAHAVIPLKTGCGQLDFAFCNLGYAEGVKDMRYRLRILKREARYLLAELICPRGKATDRAVCLEPLTVSWMTRAFSPDSYSLADLFDDAGAPNSDRLIRAFSDRL